MTTPIKPIDESDLMKLAIEEQKRPYLTATRHAGWLILNEFFYESNGEWRFHWLASNNVTGRIIGFITLNDESEPCYESAAERLVELTEDLS